MYQLLYYSSKNYNPYQNKISDIKKNEFTKKQQNSFLDAPSKDKTNNIVVNNELIKTIDNAIEYFEKETITFLSCF